MRDSELLESAAAGDTHALAELVARHHATLYALAYGILSDSTEAEQIVGSAFSEVQWQARHFSPSHYPVSRWLSDITRMAAVERLRARASSITQAPARQ
ncbi:MAG TPA: sigma factor [Gemmatimonadales bacterium]|nr:sigma factor [Gemmatimonadales bacterium]